MRSRFEVPGNRNATPLARLIVVAALWLAGCGDLGHQSYGGYGQGIDGGACLPAANGYHACCVDRPFAVGVSLALAAGGTLKDLDVSLGPQDWMVPSLSTMAPARGSPGANAYWIAVLENAAGQAQTSLVFGPLATYGDGGYGHGDRVRFAMPLGPGTVALRIQNWDSGQVLIDLDLRGHLQLVCVDRPCLSICRAGGGIDGSAPGPLDGGTADAPQSPPSQADAGPTG